MHYYTDVLKKYADFTGRTTRKEFWMFILINLIISIVLGMIDGTTILSGLYALIMIIPGLAVGARRLHDINKSGWWQLLVLIPFIGIIILIVFFALDSVDEENKYGAASENKEVESREEVTNETTVEEAPEVEEAPVEEKEAEENK